MRHSLFALLMLVTAACAPRGEIRQDPAAVGIGRNMRVLVATNRGEGMTGRSDDVRFGLMDISVPPDRAAGTIKYPPTEGKADPRTDFLVTRQARYASARAFQQGLREELRKLPADERDVVLFVHGYNNTFAEGLYRFAQINHDTQVKGVPVHYSWPSFGNALAYTGDRDSILYSRDGLEETLDLLLSSGARQVIIVGHSMGSSLVMESMRQMAIAGKGDMLQRIDGVVLMSPDIDVDVFRMQASAIKTLPEPFLIFTSSHDKALNLSARLSGEPVRLGGLSDAAALGDLKVTLIDVGAFNTGLGHFNAAESPALIGILSNIGSIGEVFEGDVGGRLDVFSGAALTVERATRFVHMPGAVLSQRRR